MRTVVDNFILLATITESTKGLRVFFGQASAFRHWYYMVHSWLEVVTKLSMTPQTGIVLGLKNFKPFFLGQRVLGGLNTGTAILKSLLNRETAIRCILVILIPLLAISLAPYFGISKSLATYLVIVVLMPIPSFFFYPFGVSSVPSFIFCLLFFLIVPVPITILLIGSIFVGVVIFLGLFYGTSLAIVMNPSFLRRIWIELRWIKPFLTSATVVQSLGSVFLPFIMPFWIRQSASFTVWKQPIKAQLIFSKLTNWFYYLALGASLFHKKHLRRLVVRCCHASRQSPEVRNNNSTALKFGQLFCLRDTDIIAHLFQWGNLDYRPEHVKEWARNEMIEMGIEV